MSPAAASCLFSNSFSSNIFLTSSSLKEDAFTTFVDPSFGALHRLHEVRKLKLLLPHPGQIQSALPSPLSPSRGFLQRLQLVRNAQLMFEQLMHVQSREESGPVFAAWVSLGRGSLHRLHSMRNAKFLLPQSFTVQNQSFERSKWISLPLGLGFLHLLHSVLNGKLTFWQSGHNQFCPFPPPPFDGRPPRTPCVPHSCCGVV